MGTFNLTPKGLGECICKVLAWKLPLLFLGGEDVYQYLCEGEWRNHSPKDLNTDDLLLISSPVYYENDTLKHSTTGSKASVP
ncbi:unnamed protein product [Timema podura]|uniref:Uncharacterized protein n=1 Tax=Timema podura TaxID=61482 RepID=A0ABN7P7R0_TIMPD|nr:unnamed protein product [Timema podura]